MLRDQARLLRGKAQMVEQGRQRMRMIRAPEAALDEVVHPRRVPAARGRARSEWTGCDHVGQWRRRYDNSRTTIIAFSAPGGRVPGREEGGDQGMRRAFENEE